MLAWHLQQGGLSAESMRSFEKDRIPRVQRMAEQEYVRFAPGFQDNLSRLFFIGKLMEVVLQAL